MDQGVGALKRGVWNPLTNCDNLRKLGKGFYQFILFGWCFGCPILKFSTCSLHNIRTEGIYQLYSKYLPSAIIGYHCLPSSPQQLFRQEINENYSKPKMEKIILTFYKIKFKYLGVDYAMAIKHDTFSIIRFLVD